MAHQGLAAANSPKQQPEVVRSTTIVFPKSILELYAEIIMQNVPIYCWPKK